jgi:hypothetical protein
MGSTSDVNTVEMTCETAPVVETALWQDTACEVNEVGTLSCWGSNNCSLVSNRPTGVFTTMALGTNHGCALDADGIATCWGGCVSGNVTFEPQVSLVKIAMGEQDACGIRRDNRDLLCWGDNYSNVTSGRPEVDPILRTTAGFR